MDESDNYFDELGFEQETLNLEISDLEDLLRLKKDRLKFVDSEFITAKNGGKARECSGAAHK